MEIFDCIVVGNDVSSLISALFLARKMRRVLVFHDKTTSQPKQYQTQIEVETGKKIVISCPVSTPIPGAIRQGIVKKLLASCGLENDIKFVENTIDYIIDDQHVVRKRMNRLEQFQVYLVRHYPKHRSSIIRFFEDGVRHYHNYITQEQNMLLNTEYTISSFMIEWGDYSMSELLHKYFQDESLIQEFCTHPCVLGLPMEEVSSYHFFVPFFIGLQEGMYYWIENEASVMKKIIAKLQIINPKMIQSRKLKQFVHDENHKIVKVIDDSAVEYYAKHFIVGDNPLSFYPTYFQEEEQSLEKIKGYLPNLDSKVISQSLFLLLKAPISSIDLEGNSYLFKQDSKESFQLLRMLDYGMIEPDIIPAKQSILQIDYLLTTSTQINEEEVLKRLYTYIPKLEKLVVKTTIGKSSVKTGMIPMESLRKNLTINDQIEIENSEHIKMFDNLTLTGSWFRPEAGMYHLIHAGIMFGDTVEEKLYYGDDDDDLFYYLTNDEIMMMIRHNFTKSALGKTEKHINFIVGKSRYFVRVKDKYITIHRGEYKLADLSIYSTNDSLSNLLLKKVSFEEVLVSGSLRYHGEESFLYEVINCFQLDDYQIYEPIIKPKSKIYFLGVKFLFAYFAIWTLLAFLSNYVDMIWLTPFSTVLIGTVLFIRYKLYQSVHWFEWTILGMSIVSLGVSIFYPPFNVSRNDDFYLLSIGLVLLISGMVERGVVWGFHKFDYQSDYAHSSLFKVIANGLSLIWAMVFLALLSVTYITSQRYVSANYYIVFLGFFLTYYYPVLYVKANIKK
jgi:hypothetical protein